MIFVRVLQVLFLVASSVMVGAFWGGNPLTKGMILAIAIIAAVGIILLEMGVLAGKSKQKSDDNYADNDSDD